MYYWPCAKDSSALPPPTPPGVCSYRAACSITVANRPHHRLIVRKTQETKSFAQERLAQLDQEFGECHDERILPYYMTRHEALWTVADGGSGSVITKVLGTHLLEVFPKHWRRRTSDSVVLYQLSARIPTVYVFNSWPAGHAEACNGLIIIPVVLNTRESITLVAQWISCASEWHPSGVQLPPVNHTLMVLSISPVRWQAGRTIDRSYTTASAAASNYCMYTAIDSPSTHRPIH